MPSRILVADVGSLADGLPAILDPGTATSTETWFMSSYFTDTYLSWTLIWMDGMETTLKLIRAAQ